MRSFVPARLLPILAELEMAKEGRVGRVGRWRIIRACMRASGILSFEDWMDE